MKLYKEYDITVNYSGRSVSIRGDFQRAVDFLIEEHLTELLPLLTIPHVALLEVTGYTGENVVIEYMPV